MCIDGNRKLHVENVDIFAIRFTTPIATKICEDRKKRIESSR